MSLEAVLYLITLLMTYYWCFASYSSKIKAKFGWS